MKKKILSFLLLGATVMILAACGNLQNSSLSTNGTSEMKESVQTTSSKGNDSYNTLLQGKQYQVSPISGISSSQNDNKFNVQGLEDGLIDVSKNVFAPNEYTFQEGQIIKENDAIKWVKRKSSSNPEGLNPEDNGSTAPNSRNPMYMSQIVEDDFYKADGNNYILGGISIGISMNQVDYYTKENFGATFETKISTAEQKKQGQIIANKIISRLRQREKAKEVPILVALYSEEPSDSIVSGSYISYAVSKNGTKSVSSWENVNEKNQLLPTVNGNEPINKADADRFSSFKGHIQTYFPKLSGVTAKLRYKDNNLKKMSITINTQFFGASQINSFTQYTSDAAARFLPSGVPIEIKIESVNGVQAFISRDEGEKEFYSHIF